MPLTYYLYTYAKTDKVRYSPASAHISYSQPYYTSRTAHLTLRYTAEPSSPNPLPPTVFAEPTAAQPYEGGVEREAMA